MRPLGLLFGVLLVAMAVVFMGRWRTAEPDEKRHGWLVQEHELHGSRLMENLLKDEAHEPETCNFPPEYHGCERTK